MADEQVHQHKGVVGREKILNPAGDPYIDTSSDGVVRDAAWMDAERKRVIAHEYLTHIGEAKQWIEVCIKEDLPAITDLEDGLRNGVFLAKLARFFSKESVKRIYDEASKEPLNLRHSDNFNSFAVACRKVGLPKTYFFELTDLYDKKNMPKVVYMIHALAHYLHKRGLAPPLKNLAGQLFFTEDELNSAAKGLGNLPLPSFGNLGASMDKELGLTPVESDEEKTLRECRELQSLYESQMRELLVWVAATTEKLNNNAIDANDGNKIIELRVALTQYEREKIVRADKKGTLLADLTRITETLASKQLAAYTPPADVTQEAVAAAWDAMLAAEAARRQALELAKGLAVYDTGASRTNAWLDAVLAEHASREFSHSSADLRAAIAAHEVHVSTTKPAKADEFSQVAQALATLQQEQTALGMTPSQPEESRAVEAIQARFAELDTVDGERLAALQAALAAAERRDAYEAAAASHVAWLEETIGANNQRDFPTDVAEVQALIDALAAAQGELKEQRAAERDGLAAQLTDIQNDMEFTPSRGKSTHDISEKWNRLEESVNNRTKALEMHRKQLEDHAWSQHFRDSEDLIIQLQANIRGVLQRRWDAERRKLWKDNEEFVIKLQAIARGLAVRRKYKEMMDYYRQNEAKIIHAQAIWRGKLARTQYQNLMRSDKPTVSTVQRFLHLLDDSDKDFDEEIELERLKQQVIFNIRDNAEREREVNQLDIKIALLIKNRSSLEDVVETTKQYRKKMERASIVDPSNLKALDKETRDKLEGYGHLFYLLQTQPQYLARLLFNLKSKDKAQKFVEGVVLTLYGYAQNAREEYLLLKLIKAAITVEMEQVTDLQDIVRGNPIFVRLVVLLSRGAKERQFLHDLLQPLVQEILEAGEDADMEADPIAIYRTMIRDDEVHTGRKSTLPWDAPLSQVLQNENVLEALTERLRRVRTITDRFLQAIIQSLPKMPYPIRYIAQQMLDVLKERFPETEEAALLKIVGNLIYYRYMNPAIVAPEAFDVIDALVTADQRKTLAEISKMLQQVATDKHFNDDAVHMSPLNDYISTAHTQFAAFFRSATEVPSAEDHYQIDPLDDLAQTQKPVVYISANELFTTHALLLENLDEIATSAEDKDLRTLIGGLGMPPSNGIDMTAQGHEIALVLSNKFVNVDQTDAENRTLFVQTKRFCLNVLRVQRGANLLDILESPVTNEHLKIYELQQERERKTLAERATKEPAASSLPRSKSDITAIAAKQSLADTLASTSLVDLKKLALENLDRLERVNLVTKSNNYQDMLNAIGRDIRNKNRRRILRRSELVKLKGTLSHLQKKTEYLEQQKQSYIDYVQSCMTAMQDKSKKATKKTVLPFTRQYQHMQQLKRQGKTPKFGSYEYDAQRLHEKGVLVELKEVPSGNWKRVSITISSDEVGVFEVQGKFMGVNLYTTELRLEDLLQRQFDNVQTMTLFGSAVVNVNLLLFLINKKFYV